MSCYQIFICIILLSILLCKANPENTHLPANQDDTNLRDFIRGLNILSLDRTNCLAEEEFNDNCIIRFDERALHLLATSQILNVDSFTYITTEKTTEDLKYPKILTLKLTQLKGPAEAFGVISCPEGKFEAAPKMLSPSKWIVQFRNDGKNIILGTRLQKLTEKDSDTSEETQIIMDNNSADIVWKIGQLLDVACSPEMRGTKCSIRKGMNGNILVKKVEKERSRLIARTEFLSEKGSVCFWSHYQSLVAQKKTKNCEAICKDPTKTKKSIKEKLGTFFRRPF